MRDREKKVLMTGAAGYVANQLLPSFRKRYKMVLVDVKAENPEGDRVEGVQIADLVDPDRTGYARHFEGADAVVHLAFARRKEDLIDHIDHFLHERQNVEMAYNVLRTAFEAGVPRLVFASPHHAADWYENALIHKRKMEVVDPYALPLSDNFYGWCSATHEHMGFVFACGTFGRKMGVVMVRVAHAREVDPRRYGNDPGVFKRNLGAYVSPRDLTQLFVRAIETEDIDNEHGIPWQVVYGISNNTRAFWSLANARRVLGYQPEDDSEAKFAHHIQGLLTGEGATGGAGRVGLS